MGERGEPLDIRVISSTSRDYLEALHFVLDAKPPTRECVPASPVAGLLASVERGTASIDLLLGAYREGESVAVCLGIESPGSAALVLVRGDRAGAEEHCATVTLLQAIQPQAWERSIALLEALVPPDRLALGGALREAGFNRLTRLIYLDWRPMGDDFKLSPVSTSESRPDGSDLIWLSYDADRRLLFEEAIERTYLQSLDCPELTGLRAISDVLIGHRAAGIFDPALWFVALQDGVPAGVILLNRIPSTRALELVYMGVAPEARGHGVGDALMRRGLGSAVAVGAKVVALAVDERNTHARRLYDRWGFTETSAQEAWIVSPFGL